MHCGILINLPYSEFYQWLRMSGFLLFCFNIHVDSLAEFHSMTVHDETNIALIIATFNCLGYSIFSAWQAVMKLLT